MTICLSMIVKNEAAIITRCLDALAPWIDRFSIHDTGSTDDTVQVIRDHMATAGIPGSITQGEFLDFAQARNAALEYARLQGCDWLLLCDADMELEVTDPTWRDQLGAGPGWGIMWHSGDLAYPQPRLIRSAEPATYVGVTHEYLAVEWAAETPLPGVRFIEHSDSGSRAEKFPRDLRLLTARVAANPDDSRAVFYLAQTQRDLGMLDAALATYRLRATLGGWDEEVWFATFQVALLTERLDADPTAAYLAAYDLRPSRVEPLVELARLCRERGQTSAAWVFAARAAAIPPTTDALFVDGSAWGWRLHDEAAVAAYWAGDRTASAAHAQAALADPALPPVHHARVRQNLTYALQPVP